MIDNGLNTKAVALASRLMCLQVELNDKSIEERQRYLTDEVERALRNIPNEDHNSFLDCLKKRFPSLSDVGVLYKTEFSYENLLEMVTQLSPELSESQKKALIAELDSDTAKRTETENERMASLLEVLLDSTTTIEKQMWTVLNELNNYTANNIIRIDQRCNMDTIKAYLKEESLTAKDVEANMMNLRRLFAALIFSINAFPDIFFNNFLTNYKPSVIENLVEKGSLFKAKEILLWEKYVEMSKELTDQERFKSNVLFSLGTSIEESTKRFSRDNE